MEFYNINDDNDTLMIDSIQPSEPVRVPSFMFNEDVDMLYGGDTNNKEPESFLADLDKDEIPLFDIKAHNDNTTTSPTLSFSDLSDSFMPIISPTVHITTTTTKKKKKQTTKRKRIAIHSTPPSSPKSSSNSSDGDDEKMSTKEDRKLSAHERRIRKSEMAKQKRQETKQQFEDLRVVVGIKPESSRGDILEATVARLRALEQEYQGLKAMLNVKRKTMKQHMSTSIFDSSAKTSVLKRAFATSTVGLVITQNRRILSVNSRFEEWFGYTEQELRAMKVQDLLHPCEHDKVIKSEDMDLSEVIRHEKRLKHRSGQFYDVKVMTQAVQIDPKGVEDPYMLCCIFPPEPTTTTEMFTDNNFDDVSLPSFILPGTSESERLKLMSALASAFN